MSFIEIKSVNGNYGVSLINIEHIVGITPSDSRPDIETSVRLTNGVIVTAAMPYAVVRALVDVTRPPKVPSDRQRQNMLERLEAERESGMMSDTQMLNSIVNHLASAKPRLDSISAFGGLAEDIGHARMDIEVATIQTKRLRDDRQG